MENEMVKIYKHQLKFGCKRPSCTKIFCKATCDDKLAETVATILSLYSDNFVCENINKSFINIANSKEHKDKGFWCTDLLLFYLNAFQNKKNEVPFFMDCSESISEKTPYVLEDEDIENSTELDKKILGCLSNRKIIHNLTSNLEMKVKNINLAIEGKNSHKFCKYFNKENVCQEENIVLTGIVGILLKKYDKCQNYALGLLIVRIINFLGDTIDFSVQQFSIIHKIFFNIRLIGINTKNAPGSSHNLNVFGSNVRDSDSTCHNCSDESIRDYRSMISMDSNSPKRSRIHNSEHSNSYSEEYEQYSILPEELASSILMEAQRAAPETPITNRSAIPPMHNVTINGDFDLSLSVPNNTQDSPALDLQNESFNDEHKSSDGGDIQGDSSDEKDVCYKNIFLQNNSKYTCLNTTMFNKNDLIRSVYTFASYLNSAIVTDIRENKKIETSLNIFYLLYLMNEEVLALGYKRFYLTNFCAKINFREEFKFYRAKSKTPLNFSFILPVHIKAELIKAETNDMMKASLQDSFFRALFEGHIGPYLFITVSRDNIYNESMDIVRCLNIEDVRKQLRITFKNEEGVDSGGIRKEYFQLLSHEIKHDERLFRIHENTIWLRNDCLDMSSYITIGRILGIALYNNVVLNIPFPSVFFKKLLNKKTTFYDLREIDPDLFMSLSNLKKLSDEEICSLGLTFTINYTSSKNKIKTYNLTGDKTEKLVTKANINSFVNRYADFYINRAIHRQFEAIKRGFLFVIEKDTLLYLDHKELEKIIMGSNDFDVHALRSTASYSGYNFDSEIICWFWEIFESYGRKMRKKLLQFITGNDRIPVAGPASMKLVIMKNGCDTDRLPSSQTCFNTLLLPEYSSKKKLESKMQTALEMTAGFYLL